MNTTSQYITSFTSNIQATPLKKRIVKVDSSYTDEIIKNNTTGNTVTELDITNNTQETNLRLNPTKENEIDEKDLQAETIPNIPVNIDTCGNKETKCNDNVQNNLGLSSAPSMKTNNIQGIPKKASDVHNSDDTNCNNKNDNESVSDKNISSLCLRELQDLLKSPPKKTDKLLHFDNIAPTNENIGKINDKNNDYKQFCDTMQSELCNTENYNTFEDINFLHDDLLNTAINIEDTKASDILLSSIPDINTLEYIDESLIDFKEDPPTDPLFISDREGRDVDPTFTGSNTKPPALRRSDRVHKRSIGNYNDVKRYKLNTEEEHILKELKDIKEEDLSLSAVQQLASLRIELVHEVPSQHKVETTGAHATTNEEKNLFRKYGPLRKGPYSPTEDKIITKNWNTFCKLHEWDSKNIEPFLNWRHDGRYYIHDMKERQKFVQFLANGLPWRTLYSVHSRFKILYCNKITNTRYTSKEDQKILTYVRNKHLDKRSTKYVELAKLLGRTSRSVSKRYRYLKRTQNKSVEKLKWTLPLIKKFIKTLLSVTKSNDVEEFKHVTLPMPVWQKMEEKLNIDGNVLKTFWQHQLHMQLFSTNPIYLDAIKIQLIEYMYKKGISSTREIIWPNVAQYFDGATAVFLCRIFFYLVQECNMTDTDNFADVVEYLYHEKIPQIRDTPKDKFLPRIIYKNGKIDVLHLDNDTSDINTIDNGADCDTNDV